MRRASVCFVWSLLAFVVVFVFFLLVSALRTTRLKPARLVAACLCLLWPFVWFASLLRTERLNAARFVAACLFFVFFFRVFQLSGRSY